MRVITRNIARVITRNVMRNDGIVITAPNTNSNSLTNPSSTTVYTMKLTAAA